MLSPRTVLGWNLRALTLLLALSGLLMLRSGPVLVITGVIIMASGLFLWFVGGRMIRQGRQAQKLNTIMDRYKKADHQIVIGKRIVWAGAVM